MTIPNRTLHKQAAFMLRNDINTDSILPAAFMITTSRSGLAKGLFYNWRFVDHEQIQPDFFLNKPAFRGCDTLVIGKNFGCGSSREHAVWALVESGFDTIIAPSFNETFVNNAVKNGLATIVLSEAEILKISAAGSPLQPMSLMVNLFGGLVQGPDGETYHFNLTEFQKGALIDGVNDFSISLRQNEAVNRHWHCRVKSQPWLVPSA